MNNTNKQKRVKAEELRLMELFAGADQNQLDFIKKHVQQLAWTNISIDDLQKQIDEEGSIIPYQNGKNQSGMQQNPACKLLIDYQKLSNTSFRALQPVLPDKPKTGRLDVLKEFMSEPMTEEEKEQAYKKQMEELEKIRNGIPVYSDDDE